MTEAQVAAVAVTALTSMVTRQLSAHLERKDRQAEEASRGWRAAARAVRRRLGR